MISQKYLNEIKNAGAGCNNLMDVYAEAKCYRDRLEALPIEEELRDYLVEPIAAAEVVFWELLEDEQPRA